jgi:hypothetical protein
MFKKSAPVLLLGSVMLAVSCAATAQDKGSSKGGTSLVPTVAGSGKVTVESLVQRYQTLAGSPVANATALVTGVRDGTQIKLSAMVSEQIKVPVTTTVTETIITEVKVPSPVPPGYVIKKVPKTVTKQVTTYRIDTITREEITLIDPPSGGMNLTQVDIALALTSAVFTQNNIATPPHKDLKEAMVGVNGVLTQRAKPMGWGEIAQNLGFEVK